MLTSAAYDLYSDVMVMTVDVEQYPAWAGQFVPLNYKMAVLSKYSFAIADTVKGFSLLAKNCHISLVLPQKDLSLSHTE